MNDDIRNIRVGGFVGIIGGRRGSNTPRESNVIVIGKKSTISHLKQSREKRANTGSIPFYRSIMRRPVCLQSECRGNNDSLFLSQATACCLETTSVL